MTGRVTRVLPVAREARVWWWQVYVAHTTQQGGGLVEEEGQDVGQGPLKGAEGGERAPCSFPARF